MEIRDSCQVPSGVGAFGYLEVFYSAFVGGGTVHAWDRSAERPEVAA